MFFVVAMALLGDGFRILNIFNVLLCKRVFLAIAMQLRCSVWFLSSSMGILNVF